LRGTEPTTVESSVGVLQPSKYSRLILSFTLLYVFLQAIPDITYPLGRDQATYCFIAQRLLEGKRLYLELWDNKPPGIFYLYAVIVKIFGHVMWSVGMMEILWLLAISFFIFKFAEKHLGTAAAVIAVLIHTSWRIRDGYWDAGQPENYLMLLVFVSYFLVLTSHRRGGPLSRALSGLLFGAAFWLKYTAILLAPLVVIIPFVEFVPQGMGSIRLRLTVGWREWLAKLAPWAAGFALAVVGVPAYFWLIGAWPAMREVQFHVLPRYNAMVWARTPDYWKFAVLQVLQYHWGVLTDVALLVAVLMARRAKDLHLLMPALLALTMGTLALLMQTRVPSYAFETTYPFLAMFWGYLVVKVFQGFRALARASAARGWKLVPGLVWLVFANLLYLPLPTEAVLLKLRISDFRHWQEDPGRFYANYPWARVISHFDDQFQVIHYLQQNSSAGDGLFVWGSEPLIYFLTRRNPPTRFVSNLGVLSLWVPEEWREELMSDLEKSQPRYIVVARDDKVPMISFNYLDSEGYLGRFPVLARFIAEHYRAALDVRAFTVYRHE
jgi:hypothetical protein